jgi:tRNA (guanine37-N1)-methyltransferase
MQKKKTSNNEASTRADKNREARAKALKLSKKKGAKRFHVITLFPELCEPYTEGSIVGRAQEKKLIKVDYYNPRDFTDAKEGREFSKEARVDQRPYGGGPGMVLRAEPYLKAIEKAKGKRKKKVKTIFFAPGGRQFTNDLAREWVKKYDEFIFISGRYEGIDARVKTILRPESVSVGPFVLTGGELPAMICIDAMTRQVPGSIGDFTSLEEERVASPDSYTRPEVLIYKKKKYKVPDVLLSGDHKKMDLWRKEQIEKLEEKSHAKDAN